MSTHVYSSGPAWASGIQLWDSGGYGARGADVPVDGRDGASVLAQFVSLPADADVELTWRITSWPGTGTLLSFEDGGFYFYPAADGVVAFDYQPVRDGVDYGAARTVAITTGVGTLTVSGTATPDEVQATGSIGPGAPTVVSGAATPNEVQAAGTIGTLAPAAPQIYMPARLRLDSSRRAQSFHSANRAVSFNSAGRT